MAFFDVENLSFKYPGCDKYALKDVSFCVNKGEFIVLCGDTGSGKTTLLRLLKKELSPMGEKKGRVLFKGKPVDELSEREAAGKIGYVMQAPEQQIVTDKVWHELAFGLENLGAPKEVIARRVAETASYFGIENWYDKDVNELSGGQKQLLNLAAVMVMEPSVIIFDEPTSRLDPIAASNFLFTIKKLNENLGITVIISEHRLEELIPLCDRLMVLRNGKVVSLGAPREVIEGLCGEKDGIVEAMPGAVRLYRETGAEGRCPLTVKEGRGFVETFGNKARRLPEKNEGKIEKKDEKYVLDFKNVFFRYERNLPDVLKELDFSVRSGEVFCVLGGNGAGKSTMLLSAMSFLRPYNGEIRVLGKKLRDYRGQSLFDNLIGFLPQNVQTLFLKDTVKEELAGDTSALPFDVTGYLSKHPYDLSGGEQQLVGLAKVLMQKPKILLADEPTKGLDAAKKREIGNIFRKLGEQGVTVVAVTHDTEFAAEFADRCGLLFKGKIVAEATPHRFFAENNYYTTSAAVMSKGYYDGAVTIAELAKLCLLNKNGKAKDGVSE
jgi:energy-coupling factor transport system ATP-binding protein